MKYYVIIRGNNGMTLFLADRSKTKKQWWTYDLILAIAFYKESAAKIQVNKLRFKRPEVVNYNEALEIEKENDYKTSMEEHIFSSEALGQE